MQKKERGKLRCLGEKKKYPQANPRACMLFLASVVWQTYPNRGRTQAKGGEGKSKFGGWMDGWWWWWWRQGRGGRKTKDTLSR